MELKWVKGNPLKMSAEEIRKELLRLSELEDAYSNQEAATKVFLNSIYGAFGSKYFVFFDLRVAEAVTLQGQDLIKYSEKVLNRYFNDFWHKDTKTHELLGITEVGKVSGDFITYCDTDSAFLNLDLIYKNTNFPGTGKEFILKIYEVFLADYLNKCFDIYAKKFGTENGQNFELEKVVSSGLWLAKKKYLYDTVWKDPGIHVKEGSEITAKGVEIVQSSSPPFARASLKKLVAHIFEKKRDFSVVEMTKILKKLKGEFALKDIEEISMSSSINDYEKYVIEDKERLVLEKGIPMHVRAAATYNHLLFNSPYRKKYSAIRSGEKVKYYHVKGKTDDEVFAYIAGMYPIEFAPPINHDFQFNKSVVAPINRCVEAMGFPAISPNLSVGTQLF